MKYIASGSNIVLRPDTLGINLFQDENQMIFHLQVTLRDCFKFDHIAMISVDKNMRRTSLWNVVNVRPQIVMSIDSSRT